MVEILHRAMDLKVSSESQFQMEESETAISLKPLERISLLKQELDMLTNQARKYVEYHHMFAKIPSSKRY